MYSFEITFTPGFYNIWRGREFLGIAARRSARKGQRGFWTFEPVNQSALLETFKTKQAIANWLEDQRNDR